ncbi:MAG TPA: tetratricopeptide repeat protein [bacterium]|nr:tetratricopeptide repeat protein [bacterium]HPS30005.1 tetratricopeptide repeat protein [bacterium]
MKIKCPHCNTNYNVDDSRIPEKGLLVKCSVCQNQYRIKKKQDEVTDDDIVGQTLSMMDTAMPGEKKQEPVKPAKETIRPSVRADSDDEDENGLFDEPGPAINKPEPVTKPSSVAAKPSFKKSDFENDNDGEENTLNFKVKDFRKENAPQNKPENPAKLAKTEDFSDNKKEKQHDEFGVSSDRFDEDSLFDNSPSPKKEQSGADDLFRNDFEFPDDDIKESAGDSLGLFKESPFAKKEAAKSTEKASTPSKPENKKPQPDDFLKDLFNDAEDHDQHNEQGLYFRNKVTGKIIGPIDESDLEKFMSEGVISEEDDVSTDGLNWESGNSSKPAKKDSQYGLTMDEEEGEAFESLNFDKKMSNSETGVFKDVRSEFEDTSFTNIGAQASVDHVFIPDEFISSETEKSGTSKAKSAKKGAGAGSSFSFYAILSISTIIVLGLIGGGVYYYIKFIKGNKGNILDNISESIAVNTGTLVDVREALNKDIPSDYINSIGILKQYIKSEDSAPSAVGLDGQVKFNLLISYNKRIESSATTTEKIDEAMKKAPENVDLIKAKALSLYEEGKFDEALVVVQPLAETNDAEIFYILGLCAAGKKDLQKAEQFFNAGFIQSNGKSTKIMYALAEMKNRNGDSQSATAFLNRIITENKNYLKAHLLKAKILMNTEGKIEDAEKFLKGVDTAVISQSEEFQKAEFYQMLATLAHKQDRVTEAIMYYEKAVAINKTDTAALVTIGDFYVQTSNSAKAMEYYDMALKIDAKNTQAILGKTEIFIQLGQNDRVFLEIAKLDIKSVTDAQSLIRLGKIYDNVGDKGKAIEYYDLSIKTNPSLIEPYVSKAIILLEFKKTKEIDEIATILSKLGKENYAYNLIKGIVFYDEANYQKATEFFTKAVERNTMGDERVFYFYGLFLFDQQKYEESSKMLEKAYRSDPRKYHYMQAYAESLEKEKKYKSVIALLEAGEYNEKRMYRSYISLSNAFYYTEKYEEALNFINKAMALNSQNTYIYYLKSRIYYAMEKYNEAEKEIDTAVVLDMRNFDNYMMYARILSKKGDYKGAIEKIEAAEKIDSSDQELMLMKGIVYRNLEDFRSALQYFRKVSDNSLRKEAYLEIGECYLQLNNQNEAMKYFRKAEASGNKLANKHLAMIYYESGKLDTAVSYYRKALRADKNDIIAMKQLGYIYKEKQEWGKALSYLKMYLKRITDPYEKRMITDEVFYLEKNMPHGQVVKNTDDPNEIDSDDAVAIEERAKELYIEGRALRQEDPKTAREKFREIMSIVPKTSEYYKKAFKAFNKLNSEDSK